MMVLVSRIPTGCLKNLCPSSFATAEELYVVLCRTSYSCIGLASSWSLRPCLSQSDNRPFSYSPKEPRSSVIFILLNTRRSIKWR